MAVDYHWSWGGRGVIALVKAMQSLQELNICLRNREQAKFPSKKTPGPSSVSITSHLGRRPRRTPQNTVEYRSDVRSEQIEVCGGHVTKCQRRAYKRARVDQEWTRQVMPYVATVCGGGNNGHVGHNAHNGHICLTRSQLAKVRCSPREPQCTSLRHHVIRVASPRFDLP